MIKIYNFLTKYGNLLALTVSIIILIIFFININSGFNELGFDTNTDLAEVLRQKDHPEINFFNFALKAAIVMTVIAALAWLLFGIVGLFLNPKGSLKFIISFVIIVVLFLIFYNMAPTEGTGKLGELIADYNLTKPTLFGVIPIKFISAGLSTMLSLFGLSILTLILSEIISFFK